MMSRPRCLALLALCGLLAGCDVAAVAYLASKGGSKSKSSTPAPDTTARLWMANLSALEADQQEALLAAGGNPDPLVWTQVGTATGTTRFPAAPATLPPGMNTVLVQATVNQQYEVDAIEILDGAGTVIDWVSFKGYTAGVDTVATPEIRCLGTPDGVTVLTTATSAQHGIVFARRTGGTIDAFRVHLWAPNARTSGDVEWAVNRGRGGDQIAGGIAVSTSGVVVTSYKDASSQNTFFDRIESDGTTGSTFAVEVNTTGITGGAPSVAIDNTAGFIYVASLYTPGAGEEHLEVKKFQLSDGSQIPGLVINQNFIGKERVEANGLCLDSARSLIVAGGSPRVAEGINHWVKKLNVGNSVVFDQLDGPLSDTNDTYWFGVAADPAGNVFMAGSITGAGQDFYVRGLTAAGGLIASDTQSTANADLGTCVAADALGNVYFGGYLTGANGRDGVIYKYNGATMTPLAGAFPLILNGPGNGDDEILGLAVDEANFLYAVGYETVSAPAQGKNWTITKFNPAGDVIWRRTHHEAGNTTGADRAVSVCVNGGFIVVTGEVTLSGGGVDIHVRKYVK